MSPEEVIKSLALIDCKKLAPCPECIERITKEIEELEVVDTVLIEETAVDILNGLGVYNLHRVPARNLMQAFRLLEAIVPVIKDKLNAEVGNRDL
jgi:hypothetical protein